MAETGTATKSSPTEPQDTDRQQTSSSNVPAEKEGRSHHVEPSTEDEGLGYEHDAPPEENDKVRGSS